jgi:hypothetical protein
LFDVTRGTDFVLFVYVGDFSQPGQLEMLEAMAQQVRVVAITSAGAKAVDAIGFAVVSDEAGEFAAAYAPGVNTGYLIRPDGYVAYHARPLPAEGFGEYWRTLVGTRLLESTS